MKRWVNDYNIAERVFAGYRPIMPLETKDVGGGTQAMLMEMVDADYAQAQKNKQIKNDLISPFGGIDLEESIKAEIIVFVSYKMTKWDSVELMMRKLFNCKTIEYIKTILQKKENR